MAISRLQKDRVQEVKRHHYQGQKELVPTSIYHSSRSKRVSRRGIGASVYNCGIRLSALLILNLLIVLFTTPVSALHIPIQPPPLVVKPKDLSVPIGGVIQLFSRYGYLNLSIRVISKTGNITTTSRNSSETQNSSWIFMEPINNVIEPTTVRIEESSISTLENDPLPFHNLFHIDLCEDPGELLEAYFKNFSIEGLDTPWKAFGGGWRLKTVARYFGIDAKYINGDYRYVLVKVLLVRGSGEVIPLDNVTIAEHYRPNFLRYIPDNDLSSYEFFRVVGTHYVHAYIIGNAVYQVFVYDQNGFMSVKRKLLLDGIGQDSSPEFMEELPESLTTWVLHMGKVLVLDSSPPIVDAIRNALKVNRAYGSPVTNLFKLHNNPELVNQIQRLLANESNAVLGIDLRGIQFLFKDPYQRNGFEKSLKHQAQLWEINLQY
ncbi:unnamed protein product [Orchesella dallaii]|uniref:MACPF domain-containing protein n=1 Tax=Orchesella dallaii TaxID=48710 RepID=A0ABP1QPQ7_9HEXA